jgi:hypothetical protein
MGQGGGVLGPILGAERLAVTPGLRRRKPPR